MPLCQRHRRIETNDRKQPRYIKDGLYDLLAHCGIQIVELRCVVPGKAGAIVAVIDVAGVAGVSIVATEDYCSVGLLKVVIFNFDFDSAIMRKIGAIKTVGRIGGLAT